jgi:eukaryotic-like serine/threonine-protein kinase
MAEVAPAGERLGAYRLVERLGQGGMAVVYRGERAGEAGFRKRVAIKRMLPQYRRDPALLERFAAEARTNARLDHPNLVHVLDFGIDPEPYLVLEFVDGVTLAALLLRLTDRGEKLDVSTAMHIGAEIAAGLDHAHHKKDESGAPLGIVHRDVSPQNVLLSSDGSVKVSDFGLVKAADNVLKTSSGVSIGKLSYMAPEQADGADVDARADIFSLGVTLWEMLTLRSLIPPDDPERATTMLKQGGFAPPSHYNREVPPALDRIVMGCLEVARERRTPSAQQVSQALRELLHERSAGYGREQLARFVQWIFAERGWDLPAPELPAAQPSDEERASRMPVTPAAVAAARVQGAPVVEELRASVPHAALPVAPAAAPRTSWLALSAAAAVGALATLAVVAFGVGIYIALRPRPAAPTPVAPPTVPAASSPTMARGVRLESPTPGALVFLGARPLGALPYVLRSSELTGEPLVALAPGYEPAVVRAERLVELARTVGRVETLALVATNAPARIAYVRFDGQGVATMEGRTLGPVPGVVRIPLDVSSSELSVQDERGQKQVTLSVETCVPERVCLLLASPSLTP